MLYYNDDICVHVATDKRRAGYPYYRQKWRDELGLRPPLAAINHGELR